MGEFTRVQYLLVLALGQLACALSLAGSCCIIHVARRKLHDVYHRLLLGLSIMDVLVTLTLVMQAFWVPKDVTPAVSSGAVGNTRTCAALGFGMRFPLGVAIFNCLLSLHFLYKILKPGKSIRFRYELFFGHFMAFCIPIIFGISGLVTESFNYFELLSVCKFATFPEDCVENPQVDCIRGGTITVKLDWAYVACLFAVSLVSAVSTVLVYVQVRRQLSRTMYASTAFVAASTISVVDTQQQERIRQVAIQAVCYTVAYLNTLVWPTVTKIIFEAFDVKGNEGEPGFYLLALLASTFFPLQGMFNGITFLRPSFCRWRKINPDQSGLWVLRRALSVETPRRVVMLEARLPNTKPVACNENNSSTGEAE